MSAWTGAIYLMSSAVASPLQEPPKVPVYSAGTEVVTVDVVVLDDRGAPVRGLTRLDFAVEDEGRPRDIEVFEPPPPAPSSSAGGKAQAPAATPRGRSFAVLFDDMGITPPTLPGAKKAIASWVHKTLADDDAVTLATSSGAVFWAGRVGRGRQELLAAVDRLRARRLRSFIRDEPSSDWRVYQLLKQEEARWAEADAPLEDRAKLRELYSLWRQRASAVLGTLTWLSEALSGDHGRKAIVVFTEQFILDPDAADETSHAVDASRRANTAVYFVDARGLSGDHTFDAESRAQAAAPSSARATAGVDDLTQTTAGAAQIAERTGGTLVSNTNDLGAGLTRVADEASAYYLLGFRGADPADGRWHQLKVKSARPRTRVRARTGYLATAAPPPATLASEAALWSALGSETAPHEFAYQTAVLQFAPRRAEREALVLVDIPLAGVRFTADESQTSYRGRLSLLTQVKDESGGVVTRLAHEWPLAGPLAALEAARRGHAVLRRPVRLRAGRYTLEAAAMDGESGLVSVERLPFEIAGASPGIALSSLVLLRATEPSSADTALDPLAVGALTLIPDLGPVRQRTDGDLSFFVRAYPEPEAESVELTLEVVKDGRVVAATRPELPAPDAQGHLTWIGALPKDAWSPGSYALKASVRQGAHVAEAQTSFALAAPASAVAAPAAPRDAKLESVLSRAGQYVAAYETEFPNLIVDEDYEQWFEPVGMPYIGSAIPTTHRDLDASFRTFSVPTPRPDGREIRHRRTRAELVYVNATAMAASPWVAFRDVYQVDGDKVRGRRDRIERLFLGNAMATAYTKATAIQEESARFNIGTAARTMNVPSLPLQFLHPRNQARFRFQLSGKRTIGGVDAVEVEFEETSRPTIVQSRRLGDLPADGRFWIDESRGVVVRSEVRLRFMPDRASGRFDVDYEPAAGFDIWLPKQMTERYEDMPRTSQPVFQGTTRATARYSGYRRLSVSTTETVRIP